MSQEFGYKARRLRLLSHLAAVLLALVSPVSIAGVAAIGSIDCVIYPSQEADVGSGSLGVLESLMVDRSQIVSEGDPLAQLESSAEHAAVALAEARANAAAEVNFRQLSADHSKRQYSRVEELVMQSVVSAKDLDDRKTEAELGEQQLRKAVENKHILALELARAKVLLEKRTIRSPFNGVVVERYKSAGEYVDAEPIVRVVQLNPLHVETIVPAEYIGDIKPGMVAEIVSSDGSDTRWTAQVDRVDSVVDVASATFGVRLALPNPDLAITAGLRCQLTFSDDKASVSSAAESLTIRPDHSQTEPVKLQHGQRDSTAESTGVVSTVTALKLPADKSDDDGQTVNHRQLTDQVSSDATVATIAATKGTESHSAITCVNEGPYPERSIAEEHAKKSIARGHAVEVVARLVSEKKGFLVMSPEFETRKKANAYVSSLETAGIADSFLPSGRTPVRVSIGAFSQRNSAMSRAEQLSSNGIDSEILPWEKTHEEFYLVGHHGQDSVATDCAPPVSTR